MASPPTAPAMLSQALKSPQQPPPPVSKRDKRRTALHERLQDLHDTFGNARDIVFRQQIHTLQVEMALIASAQPYGLEPLNDAPEEIARLVEQVSSMGQLTPDAASAGKWYSRFLQEINRTKEEKDAELAALMFRHQQELNRIHREFNFRSRLAVEEAKILKSTVRERLLQNITNRKACLMREKEQLDLQDTNALLLHPNQFTAGHPASPGGLHSSRKTRHATRHNRHDIDDIGGSYPFESSSRRKRKALADNDTGTPPFDGHRTPGERVKLRLVEQQHGPVYGINQIFTEKELALASNQAHVAATHFLSAAKRFKGMTPAASNDEVSTVGDKDEVPSVSAGAEKSVTQTVHTTRSTRATGGPLALSLLNESDRTKDRPNSPYFILANYHAKPSGAVSAPPLQPLMPEDIEDDLAEMEKAASKPAGSVDEQLIARLLESIQADETVDDDTANGFSMLHPDFPPSMDVHMVRLRSEKD
ncbi:hypothetical protein KEM54_003516 [Ascosphaera aggregata]|nr:hypothetical protein KEM54_003516 [Ascosphaera aggregata]